MDEAYQQYELFEACRGLKRLHTLSVRGSRSSTQHVVVLPSVTRLRLQRGSNEDGTGAIFPSLENLKICLGVKSDLTWLHGIVMKYKDTLKTLEIGGSGIGNEFMTISCLECAQLDTLIMPSSTLTEANVLLHDASISRVTSVPVDSLSTLYIRPSTLRDLKDWEV